MLQFFVRLQERILGDVLRILAVLSDVLGDTEDLALVFTHQGIVGANITPSHPFHQGYVGMRLEFTCH